MRDILLNLALVLAVLAGIEYLWSCIVKIVKALWGKRVIQGLMVYSGIFIIAYVGIAIGIKVLDKFTDRAERIERTKEMFEDIDCLKATSEVDSLLISRIASINIETQHDILRLGKRIHKLEHPDIPEMVVVTNISSWMIGTNYCSTSNCNVGIYRQREKY